MKGKKECSNCHELCASARKTCPHCEADFPRRPAQDLPQPQHATFIEDTQLNVVSTSQPPPPRRRVQPQTAHPAERRQRPRHEEAHDEEDADAGGGDAGEDLRLTEDQVLKEYILQVSSQPSGFFQVAEGQGWACLAMEGFGVERLGPEDVVVSKVNFRACWGDGELGASARMEASGAYACAWRRRVTLSV